MVNKRTRGKVNKYLDGLKVLGKATFQNWYPKEPSEIAKNLPAFNEEELLNSIRDLDGMDKNQAIYEYVFKDVNAYLFSNEDKKERGDKEERIYGEVCFDSIRSLITDLQKFFIPLTKKSRINFYEIGSGSGRAVILASLLGKFHHCYGYEYFGHLFELSVLMRKRYKSCLQAMQVLTEYGPVDFLHENIYNIDLRNDLQNHVVWVNYPIHKIDFYQHFDNLIRHLGGRVIIASVIQELRPAYSSQIAVQKYTFDWGESEVFFYLRQ